jgi:putative NADPH-quinone reductase
MARIVIIDGHPDADGHRFVHALARAYAEGASGVHDVKSLRLCATDIPLLRNRHDWEHGQPPASIQEAQDLIAWADHLVILYPLWLGDMPALLKAFLEQAFRPDFAFRYRRNGMPEKLLKGRSARLVVTMGMPSLFYRMFYRAHSLRSLERNVLRFVGIAPVRHSIVGSVEKGDAYRRGWVDRIRKLGRQGR